MPLSKDVIPDIRQKTAFPNEELGFPDEREMRKIKAKRKNKTCGWLGKVHYGYMGNIDDKAFDKEE